MRTRWLWLVLAVCSAGHSFPPKQAQESCPGQVSEQEILTWPIFLFSQPPTNERPGVRRIGALCDRRLLRRPRVRPGQPAHRDGV